MLRFLEAHREHYLGYIANKLHRRKDIQDPGSLMAAEFSHWQN